MNISKDNILKIENKLIEGIKSSNIELLDSLLHDDLLFIAPNRQVITKQMDLASHSKREMIVEHLIPTVEEVSIFDDTAVAVVVYETKGTMMGTPIQGRFRYIRVWKSFGGMLKVIGGSCTMLS